MSNSTVFVELSDSKRGVTEEPLDVFKVREYFTIRGYTMINIHPKASGMVILIFEGTVDEKEIQTLWESYDDTETPAELTPLLIIVRLKEIRAKIRNGGISNAERDEALTGIITLALKSYNAE